MAPTIIIMLCPHHKTGTFLAAEFAATVNSFAANLTTVKVGIGYGIASRSQLVRDA